MDPDADISPSPVVSRSRHSQSNNHRKDHRHLSSGEMLSNSSRRSNARKIRNSNDGAASRAAVDTTSLTSNRKQTSSSSRGRKSSSASSYSVEHRSITASSSSDRRHHGSTKHSSRKEEEHHQHNKHTHGSSNRRRHDRDDNKQRSRDKQLASSKPKPCKETEATGTKKTSKLMITPRKFSEQKHAKQQSQSQSNHDSNSHKYQVFYDENGQRVLIPTPTATTSRSPSIPASESTVNPSAEMSGECGYHSSDFDSDSDTSDHHQDDNDDGSSGSEIEGASDFEEESMSDYIDGASELDDNEEEMGEEHSVEYFEEDGDIVDNDDIGHETEEIIDEYHHDNMVRRNIGEEYNADSTDVASFHSNVKKRSNSPELNANRQQAQSTKNVMEERARKFYSDEIDDIRHDDPPCNKTGDDESMLLLKNHGHDLDPSEDEGATLRLDRPPTPESDRCNDIGDHFSKMTVRGRRDPPEEGRGCDPPFLPNSNIREKHAQTKKPEIRGILKKKEGATPPPVAYFGRTSQSTSEHSYSDDEDSFDESGSDPDISEVKSRGESADDDSAVLSLFEDGSVSTAKSGLRKGRFAEANAAAAAASNLETIDDDSSSNDEIDTDFSANETAEVTKRSNSTDFNTSFPTLTGDDENRFNRNKSHFMRTSDLGLTQDTIFAEQFLDNPESKPEPHYHHPSPHPPPGVQFNCDVNWISVDDGNGGHSPIAPQGVDALVATAYRTACDPMMWTPTSKTRKYMTENELRFDDIPTPAPPEEEGGKGDTSCLLWSGKFPHKHYGHDIPVIRSQGIVNMSAEELVDLLMDSSRVRDYNISSIGRTDELVLSDGTDLDTCPFSGQRKKKLTGVVIQGAKIVNGAAVGFEEDSDVEQSDCEEEEVTEMEFDDDGKKTVRTMTTLTSSKERRKSLFVGVTKLIRSTNKVPMRKSLEYFTLLHCRALTDEQGGNGYIIVGRAVTPAENATSSKDVQRAEILLNVYIIRRLREKKSKYDKRKSSRERAKMRDRCLMITVVHVKSPIIPHILAKKVSLSAAASFITDIRALTKE